ncbi:hypothetical protein JCM10207_001786 [Rhodosporidiobolus poonsookiae]
MPPAHKKQRTIPSTGPSAPAAAPGGDDLDDNFLLDDSFAPLSPASSSAGDLPFNDDDAADGDDGAAYDNVDEDSRLPAAPPASNGKKRAAPDEAGAAGEGAADAGKKAKKQKQRQQLKDKKRAAREEAAGAAGEGAGEETDDTGLLPVEAVADRIAEKQRRAMSKLSALELDEVRISESMILDTSSVPKDSRRSLLTFLKEALPTACQTLLKLPKAPGSPRVLVLSSAALRVADLCREVKEFRTKPGGAGSEKKKDKEAPVIEVAKLFAKHFKLAEHVAYLEKTYVGIAVGTPNRLEKLVNETDALHLTHLSHIILDVSHLDAKKRSLLDVPEAREEVFKLLGSKGVRERLREGKTRVVVF